MLEGFTRRGERDGLCRRARSDAGAPRALTRYVSAVSLAPHDAARYANDVARAFGVAAAFEPPGDRRAMDAIRRQVREALTEIRARPDAPSIGQWLTALGHETTAGWRDAHRARRLLAELRAVFLETSFRRTKRAERGRLLAELVVLFELEPALGMEPDPADDAEQHLKRVRRRLRESG